MKHNLAYLEDAVSGKREKKKNVSVYIIRHPTSLATDTSRNNNKNKHKIKKQMKEKCKYRYDSI